ncbi:uncharacterized protein LOC111243483 isoform X1 [Varroa destructor]|uniref:Uncharacterized protein n=1 Tax=Varroa destructor TaxID=109461 RepID=A0A7M7IZR4_VARDE|nr:uncharacterized protein LOC111243483 isoform X1 [Varroa destructor]XP_022644862.1 uncharacterized protein LOC111243483 isoform X1 [Varroa destructor]XP_022644863.1 uncharacterized protein LOC111243483 isoform X1 [Varroa destructor]XP_022644864.1 uncharacterized protein LOC111243483 isoform X1 [Varroa destructor]XP_022644865.1 uncharacterized protein LOC111243483 isoform X1 [Varroa destructor]XP_022644866.1 uncharacterized protein LOC111243483 isoform X1 [Varroa destructor]XP_022644867.1 un
MSALGQIVTSLLLFSLSHTQYNTVQGDRQQNQQSAYEPSRVERFPDSQMPALEIGDGSRTQLGWEEKSNPVKQMQPERQLLVLNEYLDATLREIRESPHLRKVLDPLRLDKEPIRFQNGHIHDVRIGGLLSLHRQGNVSLLANEGILLAELAVTNLSVSFQYQYTLVSQLKFEGRFDGSLEKLSATLHIRLAEHTSQLLLFEVVDVGRCRVHKFTGASRALNWAIRRALQFTINSNRDRIRRKVESVLRPVIEDELRKVSLEKIIANILH